MTLETLIQYHSTMPDPDFDETNPTQPSQAETQATPIDPTSAHNHHALLPATIGHYRIESLIGQGGMGAVYKAQQDSPRRTVALKVIKAGVASKNLLLRFEIEAQILGKLDHPGIATIYEAGTFDEGQGTQPFFAMEFVEGQLLTDYADSKKLGTRDRLALLAKIADAVQHAHQKGVIHRDLKPGNILVNKEGQIKVLDFGVARATDADIQTATMQTDIGQLIGTIPYMSPEQASGNPDDLDTRSDVYALGVIAYELLTGQMPYDLKQKMIHEAVRVIREDEPKTLSTINKTFRGDVEIIVSKALVKEKDRRYQSASDLGSDIERYLSNEPIEARPPSTWYQLSKFSRRNRALVAGVIAVLIVSIAGALISINFALGEAEQKRIAIQAAEDARIAEENTQRELTRANEVKKLITDMFSSINPEEAQGQDISMLKGILDDTSERLISGEIKDELIAAEIHLLIGGVYQRLGLYSEAELHLPAAFDIRTRLLKEEHPDTLRSMNNLAILYYRQGRYAEAEQLSIETLEIQRRVLGEEHPETLISMHNLALVYKTQGRYAEAEPLYLETLEIQKSVLDEEHPDTLRSMSNLASLYSDQGRHAEAEFLNIGIMEIRKRLLGEEHPRTHESMMNLAIVYYMQGRYAEAEPLYIQTLEIQKRVLGHEHPKTVETLNNLAILYFMQGRYTKAEPLYLQTMEIWKRVLGHEHPYTLDSMNNLAGLYRAQGRYAEAEPLYIQSLEIQKRVRGEQHPSILNVMNNLGSMYKDQGQYAEAEPLLVQTLEIRNRLLGQEHPNTLDSMHNLAGLYADQDRYAEAEPLYVQTLEIRERVLGEEHPRTISSMSGLAFFYAKQNHYAKAEPLFLKTLVIQKRVLGEQHPSTLDSMNNLGYLYSEQGRYAEAEPLYVQTLEFRKRLLGSDHPNTLNTVANLANMYFEQGRYAEAEPLQGQLLDFQTKSADTPEADTATLNEAAWLLLTHAAPNLRDPARALGYATRACAAEESVNGDNLWMYLDSLALAQHMTGDNASAVKTQRKAVSLMPTGADPSMPESLAKYEAALATQATESP